MPAACCMASKTPPFPLMSLETELSEAPSQSWPESKHPWGQEGWSREWGSGVSIGTRSWSEGFRAMREIMGVISPKKKTLLLLRTVLAVLAESQHQVKAHMVSCSRMQSSGLKKQHHKTGSHITQEGVTAAVPATRSERWQPSRDSGAPLLLMDPPTVWRNPANSS